MDYKKLIIEMLDKLCDERYLEYIYQLIKTFLADAQRKGIRKIEKTEFTGRNLRGKIMDYKKIIMDMLDKLDSKQLKPVYFFIRGMLGEKQNGVYERTI